MTTVFEAAGKGSAKACWVFMRRARADKFASASFAAIPSPVQAVTSCRSEKPDSYWSAPRRAKRPVIPIIEIGYVRRSEIRRGCQDNRVPRTHRAAVCCLPRGGASDYRVTHVGQVRS